MSNALPMCETIIALRMDTRVGMTSKYCKVELIDVNYTFSGHPGLCGANVLVGIRIIVQHRKGQGGRPSQGTL
jgi:hypothetical protein